MYGFWMAPLNRKRVKHIHATGHLHELTFSCYQRMPLLTNDTWRTMLAESIDRATTRHRYWLLAFVFMPEHVHLLVFPERDNASIPLLLRAIKRPYSYRIKQLLTEHSSSLLERLTVRQPSGVTTFRYWQAGPGYDRNITEPKTIEASIDYIHNNPVKRKLCERATDWKWSSAGQFALPNHTADSRLPKLSPLPPEFHGHD